MRSIIHYLAAVIVLSGITSCQKNFLQKPETTGSTTVETVFNNRTNAEQAVAATYRQTLAQNIWASGAIDNGSLTGISGESAYGESWASLATFALNGLSTASRDPNNNPCTSTDNFLRNYEALRRCFIVRENVDKVPDMDANLKNNVKAEMDALVAYRYMNMFIHYGGVPLVSKTLTVDDADLNQPRATLQQTLDFIVQTSDAAIAGLPDAWDNKYAGRMTKGAALAIKAKALTFAARPLFNSAAPYLSIGGNNNLICFGSADQKRWETAITANEAVLTWAKTNGYDVINTGAGAGSPNPNAFDDYGTATSLPNNREVLLAYKLDDGGSKLYKWYNPTDNGRGGLNGERYLIEHMGMLTNFLTYYYKKDGTDFNWPGVGSSNARPYEDYASKINDMEPRFKADNYAHGFDAWNNPGVNAWKYQNCSKGSNNPKQGAYGHGAAQSTKFYYKVGTSRFWFEHPLFRMAETYLNLAEAYNEVGNTAKALQNLNVVHNRAGLPAVTETDKVKLRAIIQREFAIEFYNESHRYFDVKHWKLADIGKGLLGGPMRELYFTLTTDSYNPANYPGCSYYDQVTYNAYWDDKMFLDPFPIQEVNKGLIVQNPGY